MAVAARKCEENEEAQKIQKVMKTKGDIIMKKLKLGICEVILAGSVMLSGCGAHAAEGQKKGMTTPAEAVECTMESLKTLDLKQFNGCTDNYIETYYNWIGFPVEKEYRVFSELQQPGIRTGKWKEKYEFNHKLSEKMMENLAWEIEDVEEDGDEARIAMEITNLNMADVMGKYEIRILENMIDSTGTGLGQMFKDLSKITGEDGGLLSIIEECNQEDLCTLNVTVTAYREGSGWKIHLDEEFINAFFGNIDAEEYTQDVQQRIRELEQKLNEKLDEWENAFTQKMEKWAEKVAGGGFF